jgi:RimJ/RimL family protein N-acetyltransferase
MDKGIFIRPFQITDICTVSRMYLSLPEKDRRVFHPCPFHWWLVVPIVTILSIEPFLHKFIRLVFPRASFFPLIAREAASGRCAGFTYLQMRRKNTDGSYLATLGILVGNDYRTKGVGSQLMAGLIKQAYENNVSKIWLTVSADNESAISLYRGNGFIITSTKDKGDLWDGKFYTVHEMELVPDKKREAEK